MDDPAPPRRIWTARTKQAFDSYVWNRKVLGAIVVASPAIIASASSFAVGLSIDDRLGDLTRQRDAIVLEIGQLDQFTKDFEAKELARASFLVSLANAGAGDQFKYTLDKLYRLNAAGSLRRIAASIYPESWKDRVADYDTMIASDYRDPGVVGKMTTVENGLVQDALRRITNRQAESNRLSDRIGQLESRKSTLQAVLNGLMYVLTVVVFFVRTAA